MVNRTQLVSGLAALVLSAWANAEPAKVDSSQANVSREQATKTALGVVPGGRIKSAELEHEAGRLVWTFDITRAGKPGATEIQVDARDGGIVSRKEESAADEAREARAEKAESPAKRR